MGTSKPFSAATLSHVLIVGGGYLGSALAVGLSELGYEVSLVSRNRPSIESAKKISFVHGDIQNNDTQQTIYALSPDVIIYTISLDQAESERDIQHSIDINLTPYWSLLDLFSRSRVRMLYFSTIQVYGTASGYVTEDRNPCPRNHYGMTHFLAEVVALRYQHLPMETLNLRLSNGYGPPASPDSNCWGTVLNEFCKDAVHSGKVSILSDGSPQRNFIYITDIVNAVYQIISSKKPILYSELNIASKLSCTVLDAARLVQQQYKNLFDQNVEIFLQGQPIRPDLKSGTHEQELLQIETSKLDSLGFNSCYTLSSGIAETLRYLADSK